MTEPIMIPCEGSLSWVHFPRDQVGVCPMCGRLVPVNVHGTAVEHKRPDVIAMLNRGDFD